MRAARLAPVGNELTRARAFFILAAFSAVAGLLVGNLGLGAVITTHSVLANGEVAMARIVELNQNRGAGNRHNDGNRTYTPVGEFSVESGETVSASLPATTDREAFAVGTDVEILYDTTDPTKVELTGGYPLVVPYLGVGIGVLALIGAAVLAIRGLRSRVRDPLPPRVQER